ncbi:MAG: DUF418 domain-containing protein [bacterium]|nr:DUF418 domain-containing protein [bacterium]
MTLDNASLSTPASAPAPGPVRADERIASIDVLRGFALLGILAMNIMVFGASEWEPSLTGEAAGLNVTVWAVQLVVIGGTMRGLFSMLFGAGVILLTARIERRGGGEEAADIYFRRNLWLLLFGVVHSYLLVYLGDILFFYGFVALVLFPFRKLSPRMLLILGSLILAIGVIPPSRFYYRYQEAKAAAMAAEAAEEAGRPITDEQKEARKRWERWHRDESGKTQERIDTFRSGYGKIFTFVIPEQVDAHSRGMYEIWFCDTAGMMLLGMAFYQLGLFSGRRSARFYLWLGGTGYALGFALRGYMTCQALAHDFDLLWRVIPWFTDGVGRLAVALGHLSVVILVCKLGRPRWLLASLAAVGRMALTNYLGHTVIGIFVFFGFGFGLYDRLEHYELFCVVFSIWIFQLMPSPLWLRRFRFGPGEWLWRSLTYWQRQPMRRGRRPSSSG